MAFNSDQPVIEQTWPWSDGYKIAVRIQNTVCTCKIGTDLNLQDLALKLRHLGIQYNKKRFAAIIITYRNPRVAFLIFAQGKLVCTGAKSKYHAIYLVYDMVERIRAAGYDKAVVQDLTVQNMVASTFLPWRVDQKKLGAMYSGMCTYDPEQFPGAIMRPPELAPLAILIFASGKMVITGMKDPSDIHRALEKVPWQIKQAKDGFIAKKGKRSSHRDVNNNNNQDGEEEEEDMLAVLLSSDRV